MIDADAPGGMESLSVLLGARGAFASHHGEIHGQELGMTFSERLEEDTAVLGGGRNSRRPAAFGVLDARSVLGGGEGWEMEKLGEEEADWLAHDNTLHPFNLMLLD